MVLRFFLYWCLDFVNRSLQFVVIVGIIPTVHNPEKCILIRITKLHCFHCQHCQYLNRFLQATKSANIIVYLWVIFGDHIFGENCYTCKSVNFAQLLHLIPNFRLSKFDRFCKTQWSLGVTFTPVFSLACLAHAGEEARINYDQSALYPIIIASSHTMRIPCVRTYLSTYIYIYNYTLNVCHMS